MTASGTTSDNERYNKRQRVTTNNNEWQEMTMSENECQQVTANDNEWQRRVILANFPCIPIREELTIMHPKEAL